MEKFLQVLAAARQAMELATMVAQFLEQIIPGKGKGTVKKELGLDLMRAAQSDADPLSIALDMAVAKLNASDGWEK